MEKKSMFRTTEEIIDGAFCPFDLKLIPNSFGINLCSVRGVSWTELEDGQLVGVTVHFIPFTK